MANRFRDNVLNDNFKIGGATADDPKWWKGEPVGRYCLLPRCFVSGTCLCNILGIQCIVLTWDFRIKAECSSYCSCCSCCCLSSCYFCCLSSSSSSSSSSSFRSSSYCFSMLLPLLLMLLLVLIFLLVVVLLLLLSLLLLLPLFLLLGVVAYKNLETRASNVLF